MEDKNELIETAEVLKALAQNEDAAVEMVRVGLDIKEEDYPKIHTANDYGICVRLPEKG